MVPLKAAKMDRHQAIKFNHNMSTRMTLINTDLISKRALFT
jgi:hypothetical protein